MKLLFDTHTFIWWDSEPLKLSAQVLGLCEDTGNTLLVSVASLWEMQIKLQLGKLRLRTPLADLVSGQQRINRVEILDVRLEHVMALEGLPPRHRDPFDRLLVAQALVEEAVLLSRDPIFADYPVRIEW
ncbi:MAG: type II toxin-antitoxin system VapC family toxin [Thermodesulfobacteriota bacterium]